MELIGTFKEVSRDIVDGTVTIAFRCNTFDSDALERIRKEPLSISIKKYREKRSLNANSYYWVLVNKIAGELGISKPRCHNLMLRKYGQIEFFDERIAYVMLPDTEDTNERMDEMQECHFAPTSQVKDGKDGIRYRAWRLLKPSHTYDTKEMSVLINGIVDDAKALGIETLPPDELERMVRAWKAS